MRGKWTRDSGQVVRDVVRWFVVDIARSGGCIKSRHEHCMLHHIQVSTHNGGRFSPRTLLHSSERLDWRCSTVRSVPTQRDSPCDAGPDTRHASQ